MTRIVRCLLVALAWAVTLVPALFTPATALAQGQTGQPAPAAAATPAPEYPIVRVGVVSFIQYLAELENRDGFNAFDVTRTYLNINAQVSKSVRFRFTPDIRRVTDGSLAGSLTVRAKYAFAQFDDVTPRGWVRLGLHQTPWLDFEEGINRYRVQGPMFAEREGLIPGSADFGAGYFTPLPGNFGEIQTGIYNGEGFTQPEANKYKSLQVRATVRPLPKPGLLNGLRVSGFYSAGWYAADRPRRVGIVMASFEHRHLVATAQHVEATENPTAGSTRDIGRAGNSAFLEVRQGTSGWAGLVRVDAYDPDEVLGANSQKRVIAGGGYWLVRPRTRIGFVATNEQVHYDVATRPTENRLLLQTHIEF